MDHNSENQELEKEPRFRHKKLVITIIGATIVLTVAGVGTTIYLRQGESTTTDETTMQWQNNGDFTNLTMGENIVTASGTTSIGVDAVTFVIDFLEDTSLYVEEVYVSSGDEVEAGTKYLKLTEESVAEARAELESTAEEAELSYRSSVISTQESKIEAKYTYEAAVLAASQALQVYEDTLASLQATLDAAEEEYLEAEEEYNEYLAKVTNNTFYADYEIDEKKAIYEELYQLYVDKIAAWEITATELEEIESSASMGSGMSASTTSSTSSTSSSSSTPSTSDTSNVINMGGDATEVESSENDESDVATISAENSNSGDSSNCETVDTDSQEISSEDMPSGGMGAGRSGESEEDKYRESVLETMSMIKERMDEAEEDYEQAKEDYEEEIEGAELKLQQLLNTYESKQEAYESAKITFQKDSLSAKTTYETTVTKGNTAKTDYETQLTSLSESLDKLSDAMEEAQENLELFESTVGDGYLYTEEAGTILMSRVEEGSALTGGDMLFAYSNPEKVTVSVSVSQDSIAQLAVGDTAMVTISDYGTFNGTIESINPVSSSDSRTSVSYTVEVTLEGDVSALESNLTATVIFGMDASSMNQQPGGERPESDASQADSQAQEDTQNTQQPNAEQPNAEQPNAEQPNAELPNGEQPESDQSEVVSSENETQETTQEATSQGGDSNE